MPCSDSSALRGVNPIYEKKKKKSSIPKKVMTLYISYTLRPQLKNLSPDFIHELIPYLDL